MKLVFKKGDKKVFTRIVQPGDCPAFDAATEAEGGGNVHPVYATYAIARDAEWVGRLFVLDMLEDGEQGIGRSITVEHIHPALVREEVVFTAFFKEVLGNKVINGFEASVGDRLIAHGVQVQKIVSQKKLDTIFEGLSLK